MDRGLSITDYTNLYNISLEEIYGIVKNTSIRSRNTINKRLNATNLLGLSKDPEIKFTLKNEYIFQHKIVIPQLKKQGHKIEDQSIIKSNYTFNPVIDILSTFKKKKYFTEIKIDATLGSFQKAVGQLSMHRYTQEYSGSYTNKRNIYQIAFPIYYKDEKTLSSQLIQFLREEMHIRIVFF